MQFNETIGIDISKPFFDAFIYTSKKHRKFQNNEQGFKALVSWVNKSTPYASSERLFIFEHTGLYSLPISVFLTNEKIHFVLIPGLELRKSLGIARGKNDKVDAQAIALYAYRRREELTPYKMPCKNLIELRKLLSLRDKLVRQRSGFMTTKRESAIFIAPEEQPTYFCVHDEMIVFLSKMIREVEQKVREIFRREEKLQSLFKLVTSIKGVGEQTAWHIIVYTSAFTLFENSRKFASYAGVAPFPYQSGISIRGKTKVHQYANKKFKSLLSNCATSAINCNPEMRIYYNNRISKGKDKMSTINVIRNKLLSRIFAVVKRGTPYVNTVTYAA